MARREHAPGPQDRGPRGGVEPRIVALDRGVMVALDHDRAFVAQRHRALDHGRGIGSVAHEIPEKYEAARPRLAGMREAGLEGLEVAVDVGEQADHGRVF